MNILIIGGTTGIGEAMLRKCVQNGDYVIFSGRNKEAGDRLMNELGPNKCEYRYLDVSKDDASSLLEKSLPENKIIHACINFAGVMYLSKLLDYELVDWVDMAKVNYIGLLSIIAAVFPKLPEESHFINISSVAAISPAVGNAAYAASKIAADTIMDSLRKEAISKGVKVSTVHLGGVDTDINNKIRNPVMKKTISIRTKTYTPMPKNDVVEAIYYMLKLPRGVNMADVFLTPANQPD